MRRLRVGVLISGRGSNLQALAAATAAADYPAEIVLVISNHEAAAGLAWARRARLPTLALPRRDAAAFAGEADAALWAAGVELVVLAGFMRILDTSFVTGWHDRLVNIHPSLLPAFRGLHAQRQALAAGVRFAGCTVHFVRAALDTGPIIAQAVVPVLPGDDEDRLSARILAAEHRLYPLAVRLFAERRLCIVAGRVEIAGGAAIGEFAALNPSDPFASAAG